MSTIWKYVLGTVDYQVISIPLGAEILAVQMQDGNPCLWVKCDSEADKYQQGIFIYGTGHRINEDLGDYIGTYQILNGGFVFHVFKEDL